ncbi:MAG: terminase gpA endonuclease subunit [Planctomycetota bacterium]
MAEAINPFPQYADDPLPGGGFALHLSDRTCDTWAPRQKVRSWDWIINHAHNHKGQPFNYVDFPWVEGICDAWDDPRVRRIFFMAGSRLGKTETFLALMLCSQFHDPDVGMIGGSTENLVRRTIGDRFYKMMENTHVTASLCPPEHRRNKHIVRTRSFSIYGAWSGSPTTLGDLDPRYLQALEFDKFTKANSEEADPAELLLERGAEIPDRKAACESTPTVKGLSRIDKYVSIGTNRRFCVPCPKCGHRQPLHRCTGPQEDGGLWWDREKDGSTTATIAQSTARYICEDCRCEWGDEDRRPAIRQGRWVAPGESIDKRGVITGTPHNAGPDESFQLSRLYGPTFSFGDYARAYVLSHGEPEAERSFANNWDGECWIPTQVTMTWQELAAKLCVGETDMGVVPKEANFVTTAIDVQIDHFVCTTFAWANQKQGYLIAYGIASSWPDVKAWTQRLYPHADGGEPVPSFVNLIDARDGNRKDEICDFCEAANRTSGPFVWPSMGARPGTMNMQVFRKLRIDADHTVGKKAVNAIEGMHLVMVNTTYTQEWIDNAMGRRKPGDPMSITMPKIMIDDEDFFSQLLNEQYNPDSGRWDRVDESTIPVDFRDACRYARCAAEVYCNGNWARVPAVRPLSQQSTAGRITVAKRDKKSQPRQTTTSKASGFVRRPSNAFLSRLQQKR